ncbi:probable disease resistance protein At5g63020 [Prosopis cineraria]|uniref:probable disease resistance protein At5g63020 n=1 Tax=Prosopis cineraria TaxID=364024 RepID=UPI00240F4C2B|nr:probable disease resistance protein At5g63020 [Prosopis cineraria]
MARRMEGKEDIVEWNHLLESLRSSLSGQYDMSKWVVPILRSSYDNLDSRKLQECFLHCALSLQYEFTNLAFEGLIDGTQRLEANHYEFLSILNKLKNISLILMGKKGKDVRLHEIIWDMAVGILKRTFIVMVNIDERLMEIPNKDQWEEDLQKNYHLRWIPDDFFLSMKALKVLNLSDTAIECLPKSVSELENYWSSSRFRNAAKSYMVRCTKNYKTQSAMDTKFNNFMASLWRRGHHLFSYYFGLGIETQPIFDEYEPFEGIGEKVIEFVGSEQECPEIMLLKDMKKLRITRYGWTSCLCEFLYFHGDIETCKIESCHISECNNLNFLFCMSNGCCFCRSLQLTGSLFLCDLKDLHLHVRDSAESVTISPTLMPPSTPFFHLKALVVKRYHTMKKLLTPELSSQLQNLEEMTVEDCFSIKEIFSIPHPTNHLVYTLALPHCDLSSYSTYQDFIAFTKD